jgi:hypothetical protein
VKRAHLFLGYSHDFEEFLRPTATVLVKEHGSGGKRVVEGELSTQGKEDIPRHGGPATNPLKDLSFVMTVPEEFVERVLVVRRETRCAVHPGRLKVQGGDLLPGAFIVPGDAAVQRGTIFGKAHYNLRETGNAQGTYPLADGFRKTSHTFAEGYEEPFSIVVRTVSVKKKRGGKTLFLQGSSLFVVHLELGVGGSDVNAKECH